MGTDVRYGRHTRDAHVHDWASRATDSATETATTTTEDTSFAGTDASDDEVWPNPSDDSLSYGSNQLSSEDDGESSEYDVNGFRADRNWQDARHAPLESRATQLSQHLDFGDSGQRHLYTADEHGSDSLEGTLVSQLPDSDAPSSLYGEESQGDVEDGKTEAWGALNEILVDKIVELAQLNAKAAAATKYSSDRAVIKSETARVALATAMDLQATAARVSVGAADIQQRTSPLRRGRGRYSVSPSEQRAGRGMKALDSRMDHRRTRTRHHSHSRSRSPSPSRSRTRRHHRRHGSRSRSRSHRRRRSRRDGESSYSDEDGGASGSSRSPRRSSHRRHKSPRSHRSEQSGHRNRSARSHKKSSRTRSRRHQSQHSSKGEDGGAGAIDQEVRKPPAGQGGSLAHMALLGSLEAGEQQLKLRKAALAHELDAARTAEAKHAAEARRLQEHYWFPDDDGEDNTGPSSGRLSASQHRSHGESALPNTDIGRTTRPLRSVALESPVRAYAVTRTVTYEENGRSAEDGEPEDSDESEALLLKIDAVAPIARWPDWAVAMLRARKFTSHQEVRTAQRSFFASLTLVITLSDPRFVVLSCCGMRRSLFSVSSCTATV